MSMIPLLVLGDLECCAVIEAPIWWRDWGGHSTTQTLTQRPFSSLTSSFLPDEIYRLKICFLNWRLSVFCDFFDTQVLQYFNKMYKEQFALRHLAPDQQSVNCCFRFYCRWSSPNKTAAFSGETYKPSTLSFDGSHGIKSSNFFPKTQGFPRTFPPAFLPRWWLWMQLHVLSVIQNAAADLPAFTFQIQVRTQEMCVIRMLTWGSDEAEAL